MCPSERLIVPALSASRNVNRFEIPTAMLDSFGFNVHLPKVSMIIFEGCVPSALGVKPQLLVDTRQVLHHWAPAQRLHSSHTYIVTVEEWTLTTFVCPSPLSFLHHITFFPVEKISSWVISIFFFHWRKIIPGQGCKSVFQHSALHFYLGR